MRLIERRQTINRLKGKFGEKPTRSRHCNGECGSHMPLCCGKQHGKAEHTRKSRARKPAIHHTLVEPRGMGRCRQRMKRRVWQGMAGGLIFAGYDTNASIFPMWEGAFLVGLIMEEADG